MSKQQQFCEPAKMSTHKLQHDADEMTRSFNHLFGAYVNRVPQQSLAYEYALALLHNAHRTMMTEFARASEGQEPHPYMQGEADGSQTHH